MHKTTKQSKPVPGGKNGVPHEYTTTPYDARTHMGTVNTGPTCDRSIGRWYVQGRYPRLLGIEINAREHTN